MVLGNLWINSVYFVGPSSGANYYVSKELSDMFPDKNVVTVFPDSGKNIWKFTGKKYIYSLNFGVFCLESSLCPFSHFLC